MNLYRSDFLGKLPFTRETKEFLFLPIDFIFRTKNKRTELDIIGIIETGHRCLVKVVNLEIFVDVLVTDIFAEGLTEKYTKKEDALTEAFYGFKYAFLEQLPGKGFSKPLKYARVFFDKKADRKKFIDDYNKKLTLANDDSSLENLIFRKTRINTCGWNKVTNFQYFSDFIVTAYTSFCREQKEGGKGGRFSPYEREDQKKLPVQVVIQSLDFLKPAEGPEKDNSIICGWDLETYTPNKFGRVPLPKFEEDVIKMCSMTFRFYHSTKPLLWVLITAIPVGEKELRSLSTQNSFSHSEKEKSVEREIKVIQTENIPLAFAQVLAQMQPDFLSGFNDGFYDWPFIKARTEDTEEFLRLVSAIRLQPWEKSCFGAMNFSNIYNKPKTIKIDAETSVLIDGYNIPGCVVFDTAPLMRRREKTETEWSLNTFLKKHGLEAKYDMSYTRMSKIFRLYEISCKHMVIKNDKREFSNYEAYLDFERAIKNDVAQGDIAINHLTEKEINELLADAPAVGYYCLRDAEAVLNLLHKLFIIQDIREMGNISFTHTKDGFYKADGIKVRNCLLAEALLPDWGIWPRKYPLAFTVFTEFKVKSKTAAKEEKTKYPGGYVIRPLRGIYGKTAIVSDSLSKSDKGPNFVSSPSFGEGSEDNKVVRRVVSDRPNSGLDFNSLYPSLIMAYNFSPEYYIENETDFKKSYPELNVETLHIKTYFKKDSEFTLEKFKREGWFIKHSSFPPCGNEGWKYENHGIFPVILRRLFAARKTVKGQMGVWQVILEKLTRDVPASFSRSEKDIIEILEAKIEKIREVANGYNGQKKKLEEMKITSYVTAIKLISEKWSEFPSYEALLDAASFKFNYYNTKQNAIKVFMNTFYGETGSQDSPFYIVTMSGGITKMGRKNLKLVKSYVEEQGFKVYYGDSVTAETPVLVRLNGKIKNLTISDLYDFFTEKNHSTRCVKKTYVETQNLESWTESGWTKVHKIMRHATTKKIYGILTRAGYVEVTEDHSLILASGKEISPKDCKIGDILLTNDMKLKKRYFEEFSSYSQIEIAQKIQLLGLNYKLSIVNGKFIVEPYTGDITGEILNITLLLHPFLQGKNGKNEKNDVFDLTTENGHFQAGIGNIIVHNTDSLYITPPEKAFEESDKKYLEGIINKETFYEEMVGTTMNQMREISEKVAEMLELKIGNPFLKMEYEEVLFPFGFLGKKNYFGIKHINSIDFSLCKSGVDPGKFMKEIFARGLPIRRRDGSIFVKNILTEMLMELCSIEETRSYEEIITQKITSKINMVSNSFTASNNDFSEEEQKIIAQLLKNYSFREPRENSHTLQMSYRKRMIKYHYISQINHALMLLKANDPYGSELLEKLRADYAEDDFKKVITKYFSFLDAYFSDSSFLRSKNEEMKGEIKNYVPIPGLEHLKFEIPNYGSRSNLILLRKPPIYTDRGTKDVMSKGYCLEQPWAICDRNYAAFITHLYKMDGLKINEELHLVPYFLAYFSELYGKLSRFLLYLPKYNLSVEEECEKLVKKDFEDKMLKADSFDVQELNDPLRRAREMERIKKKQYKNAEIKITAKIKKDLEKQFKHYFPEVICDNKLLKEKFKVQQKKIEERLERSEFTQIITKFVTEEKYDLKKVNDEIIKLFECFYIPTFVLIDLPQYMKNRTSALLVLENRKKSFMSEVNNICVTLKSYNDIERIIEELNRLNCIFGRLIKEIILEREIKKYFSELKIKTCCEQDDEFEKFLNINYAPKGELKPLPFLEMDPFSESFSEINEISQIIENNF